MQLPVGIQLARLLKECVQLIVFNHYGLLMRTRVGVFLIWQRCARMDRTPRRPSRTTRRFGCASQLQEVLKLPAGL